MKKIILLFGLCILLLSNFVLGSAMRNMSVYYDMETVFTPPLGGSTFFDLTGRGIYGQNMSSIATYYNSPLGYGAYFNGVDAYLKSYVNINWSNEMSYMFWINLTDIGNIDSVLFANNNIGEIRKLLILSEYTIAPYNATIVTGNGVAWDGDCLLNKNFTTNSWINVIVLMNKSGSNISLYYNGTLAKNCTDAFNMPLTAADFTIGSRASGNNPTRGVISEAAVWNRWLNSSEIAYIYNSGVGHQFADYPIEPITLSYPNNNSNFLTMSTNSSEMYSGNISFTTEIPVICNINNSNWYNTTSEYGLIHNYQSTLPQFSGNYNIGINCTHFLNSTISFTASGGLANVSIYVYDEYLNIPITWANITIEVNDNVSSRNFSTSTGYSLIYNLTLNTETRIKYYGTNYFTRFYYFTPTTGATQRINLYLLNTPLGTQTLLTLYDENRDPVTNALVKLEKYFLSNNSYIIVQMSKTNSEGQALLHVQLYDYYYKMEYDDSLGNILKITNPNTFMTTLPIDYVNLNEPLFYSWQNINNIYTNITIVNETGTVYARYYFSNINNFIKTGCIDIKRQTMIEDFDYCLNCTTGNMGNVSCILDTTLEGQYKIVGLIDSNSTGSWYPTDVAYYVISALDNFLETNQGFFYTAAIVTTVSFIFIGSIVGSVVGLVIGLVAAVIVGIAVGIPYSYIVFIVLLGFVVMILTKTSGDSQ